MSTAKRHASRVHLEELLADTPREAMARQERHTSRVRLEALLADTPRDALLALFMACMEYYGAHRTTPMDKDLTAILATMQKATSEAESAMPIEVVIARSVEIIGTSAAAPSEAVQEALARCYLSVPALIRHVPSHTKHQTSNGGM